MSGIPAWACRGAKVVCVYGVDDPQYDHIEAGEVYTVRVVVERNGECGVYLEGKVNPNPFWGESAYRITRFRPLITQQDDLEAHFNQFLTTGKDARQSDIAPVANAKSRAVPAIAGEGV